MRFIDAQTIYDKLQDIIKKVAIYLPSDVTAAIEQSIAEEHSETAKEILRQLLDNARLAQETGLPLCQDTGMAVFFVEMGEQCKISEGSLTEILNKAMIKAYSDGFLRKSMCHPLTRVNTGDNSPADIHIELVPGDKLKIRFMAKGGGSENMSRCAILTPAQGWQGIKKFVLQRIVEAGPNPCPPTIVGIGIGGSFDLAPIMAKKALFRPLDVPHPDAEIQKKEEELLKDINELGIGPMGLGGKTTSLGVRINMAPCHIASLPLAVNIQCHSSRYQEVVF